MAVASVAGRPDLSAAASWLPAKGWAVGMIWSPPTIEGSRGTCKHSRQCHRMNCLCTPLRTPRNQVHTGLPVPLPDCFTQNILCYYRIVGNGASLGLSRCPYL